MFVEVTFLCSEANNNSVFIKWVFLPFPFNSLELIKVEINEISWDVTFRRKNKNCSSTILNIRHSVKRIMNEVVIALRPNTKCLTHMRWFKLQESKLFGFWNIYKCFRFFFLLFPILLFAKISLISFYSSFKNILPNFFMLP